MYRKIGFLILGFWFIAIIVALMIGMYEIHRQNQQQLKTSNELHQTNTVTIEDLSDKHEDLKKQHNQLKSDVDNLKKSAS